VVIHRARDRIRLDAPDLIQQLIACDDLSGAAADRRRIVNSFGSFQPAFRGAGRRTEGSRFRHLQSSGHPEDSLRNRSSQQGANSCHQFHREGFVT
jgi:hypothetical protein